MGISCSISGEPNRLGSLSLVISLADSPSRFLRPGQDLIQHLFRRPDQLPVQARPLPAFFHLRSSHTRSQVRHDLRGEVPLPLSLQREKTQMWTLLSLTHPKGPFLLRQRLKLPGKGSGLPAKLSGDSCMKRCRSLFPAALHLSGHGQVDILIHNLVERLMRGLTPLRRGMGSLSRPLLFPLYDAFHDTLRTFDLLCRSLLLPQRLQNQVQIHLEHGSWPLGMGLFLPFPQQLQGHIGVGPLPLLRLGQQFLGEGLGQSAKGGDKKPLLR